MPTVYNLKNTYFEFDFVFLPIMFLSNPLFMDFLNVLNIVRIFHTNHLSSSVSLHIGTRDVVDQGLGFPSLFMNPT